MQNKYFLTEAFRNVKLLMPQPYKEMIYKQVSLLEKNAGFHLLCFIILLMTKTICFYLQK